MSSILTAKFAVSTVSRVARQVACYSTEVKGSPAVAKFDVTSFIGRIDALHAAQAKKGQDKRTGMNFKIKQPEKTASTGKASVTAKGFAGSRGSNNRNQNQNNKNDGKRHNNGNRPYRQASGHQKQYNSENSTRSSGPAKPTKNLKRFSDMEIDSALTDSSNEKLDLHVSPRGGVLFDNNTRRTAPVQRAHGQRYGRNSNNNNKTRNASPRTGAAQRGSPRVQRKNQRDNKQQQRRPVAVKLTPEQGLRAIRRQLASKGSSISVSAITTNTLTPYVPGLCYSAEARIMRAIQKVPQTGKYTEEELKAIVESTCKGSLNGFKIPECTKAHGQESIIPVLNSNPSFSPELKTLFLKLASGETPISSLRK